MFVSIFVYLLVYWRASLIPGGFFHLEKGRRQLEIYVSVLADRNNHCIRRWHWVGSLSYGFPQFILFLVCSCCRLQQSWMNRPGASQNIGILNVEVDRNEVLQNDARSPSTSFLCLWCSSGPAGLSVGFLHLPSSDEAEGFDTALLLA